MIRKEWKLRPLKGMTREMQIVDMPGRQLGREFKVAVKWLVLDHEGQMVAYGYCRSAKEAYPVSKAAIESYVESSETGQLTMKRWQQQDLFDYKE